MKNNHNGSQKDRKDQRDTSKHKGMKKTTTRVTELV